MEEKILEVLTENPLSPSEISLLIGFSRPTNKASTVNPTLYKLLKEDKVVKTCAENGGNPKWSIKK